MKKIIPLILILTLSIQLIYAEELTVGTKSTPPFTIIQEDGSLTGFSIELIEMIIESFEEERTVNYHIDQNLAAHLDSIKEGSVDLGIAATTITSEREGFLDFSHPFIDAGVAIMTLKENRKSILDNLLENNLIPFIILILSFMLICGHIIWLIEKGSEHFHHEYFKGITQGMWWTIVTMSTVGYGDLYPKKGAGKVFGSFVIVAGIAIFGIAVAGLSSAMTITQLQSSIEGPEDLVGEPVGVLKNTHSVPIAKEMGMLTKETSNLDEAANLLLNGGVKAVVYDEPLLKYYILNDESGSFILANKVFAVSSYGIAFPKDSKLREKVNVALLKLQESGELEKLNRKWFGSS